MKVVFHYFQQKDYEICFLLSSQDLGILSWHNSYYKILFEKKKKENIT